MGLHNVTFVMGYSVVTTTVETEEDGDSEDYIIHAAKEIVYQNDGLDVSRAQEIEVEEAE